MNDIWGYQLINSFWSKIDTINSPSPRYSFGFAAYVIDSNEYFAVCGGSLIQGEDNTLYM
jgi:hypothetical protein